MIEPLKVCKKYYPKIYRLWMEGNNECKTIAYNIYYHNYGYTFNKDIADYCKEIGLRVKPDDIFGNDGYFIS